MDQSEESQQQQYMPDAVATSYNVSVPMFSTMPPPPPLVSTTQQQLTYQEAQAQHLQHVRERLRLFWANQMQEMKPEDINKHNLPLAPIKRIMKADKDVRMIAKETAAVFNKACEMLILDITSQAWINTEEDGRRTVQKKDIAAAICQTDLYDFLEEVIPRGELREQILKAKNARQHVGSSTEATIPRNNVPQQHGVGVWIGTSAGGQRPQPFLPLYQARSRNQQSFLPGPQTQYQQNWQQPSLPWPQAQYQQNQQQPSLPWPQARYQQNQQQPSMPWPQARYQQNQQQPSLPWPQAQYQQNQQQPSLPWSQARYQQNQQQPSMPWPQARYQQKQQQPSMPWPQIQHHTPEQSPLPWLRDVLIPDQQYPEQAFLSSPQDEQIPDQQQNDN